MGKGGQTKDRGRRGGQDIWRIRCRLLVNSQVHIRSNQYVGSRRGSHPTLISFFLLLQPIDLPCL